MFSFFHRFLALKNCQKDKNKWRRDKISQATGNTKQDLQKDELPD
jgi:hypothetical protein